MEANIRNGLTLKNPLFVPASGQIVSLNENRFSKDQQSNMITYAVLVFHNYK